MQKEARLFASTTTLTDSTTSSCDTRGCTRASVQAVWDVTTPSAKTFISGVPAVQTLTFPTEADAVDGDYVVIETSSGVKWALALSKQGAEVQTVTFLAKASCVAGDFMVFYDTAGGAWAVSVNKSGTDAAPTAKGWTDIAAGRKAHVDISSATTAAQVAALFETAMDALSGFTDLIVTDDSAANGTMTLTSVNPGPVAAPTSHKKDAGMGTSAGAGTSIVGERTTEGYLTAEPTGAAWEAVAAANKDILDVTGLDTATAVVAAAELAFDALEGFTAAITTADGIAAAASIDTVNFAAKGDTDPGDYIVFYDASGNAWAASMDIDGDDPEPTGDVWASVDEARRTHVDLTTATTDVEVAALVETALNALTGFSAAFTTDDTAADGTMTITRDANGHTLAPASYDADDSEAGSITISNTTPGYLDGAMSFTQVEVGAVTAPVLKNADDSGAGTILGITTTAGTGGVNVGTNVVLSTAHGMSTGLKVRLTTSDADLPAGLATATDYYVIAPDADHLKFATSLANAQAGTAINITDIGTGTHTVTAEALSASTKLQKSNDGTNWTDVHDDEVLGGNNSQTISGDGTVVWMLNEWCYRYLRQSVTVAGGQLTMETSVNAQG